MIVFPNAKINLGLQITGKRPDGYHDLSTVFYPIAYTDVLEVIRADEFSFTSSGIPVHVAPENNLVIKAWQRMQKKYALAPVAIHLHKKIPMGAGLGGGSSNAAFLLQAVNNLFNLDIPANELAAEALQLGSDCPFFLLNQPAYASGRGEALRPLDIPALQHQKVLLVNPGISISTAWAFNQLKQYSTAFDPSVLQKRPLTDWKNLLQNDFEPIVFSAHSAIADICNQLYALGANYAAMTGTGSTVYGLFDEIPVDWKQRFPSNYTLIESA